MHLLMHTIRGFLVVLAYVYAAIYGVNGKTSEIDITLYTLGQEKIISRVFDDDTTVFNVRGNGRPIQVRALLEKYPDIIHRKYCRCARLCEWQQGIVLKLNVHVKIKP